MGLLRQIVQEAVDQGDLVLTGSNSVERITFVLSALVDGGYALVENGIPQNVLGLTNPGHELWRAYNTLADAYGWRPLGDEIDWEETLAEIRRTIFPEESERLYGCDCWYGDHGRSHPKKGRAEEQDSGASRTSTEESP